MSNVDLIILGWNKATTAEKELDKYFFLRHLTEISLFMTLIYWDPLLALMWIEERHFIMKEKCWFNKGRSILYTCPYTISNFRHLLYYSHGKNGTNDDRVFFEDQ